MAVDERIVEKIQKLLNLADGNSSPEETASAVAMASKLAARHNIELADIGELGDEPMAEETFGVAGSHRDGDLKNVSLWQGQLGKVIADGFGCCAVWRRSPKGIGEKRARMLIVGHKEDVAAAIAAKEYCHKEIDRLTAKFGAGMGRNFGQNFRMGCCAAIQEGIKREQTELRASMREEVSASGETNEDGSLLKGNSLVVRL